MDISIQKTILVNALATSTSAADSTVTALNSHNRYHTLHWRWTPGTTNNVLTIKLYFSSDDDSVTDANCTWAQEQTWTLSSTIKTRTIYQLNITGTTGGTAEPAAYYDFAVNAKRMKITYSETVSAGTLTVHLLSKPM